MESFGIETVAKLFRALADPTRLQLLEHPLEAEHTVTECLAHVRLSQGRVSTVRLRAALTPVDEPVS